jgi:hypothetical protein
MKGYFNYIIYNGYMNGDSNFFNYASLYPTSGTTNNTALGYSLLPTGSVIFGGPVNLNIGTLNTGITYDLTDLFTATNGSLNDNYSFISGHGSVNSDPAGQKPYVENMSIQWIGQIIPDQTGVYTFYSDSDDCSYIWIGSSALINPPNIGDAFINNGGGHPENSNGQINGNTKTNTISLIAGQTYPIIIQYSNGTGTQGFYLGYSEPNSSTVIYTFEPPNPPCFLENTKILTIDGYQPIQNLRKGDLIKTIKHNYVPINMIGVTQIYNSQNNANINKLYVCNQSKYPELFEDLIITGGHSILIDEFQGKEREETYNFFGDEHITDGKYRLPACIDSRTKPYNKSGYFNIYHIALDNDNYYYNYGIYANGLLVETCSLRYLKELSGMKLL